MLKLLTKLIFKNGGLDDLKNKLNKILINQGKILDLSIKDKSLNELNDYHYSIFSQFNEDSVIQYLIKNLKIENKIFIEIGVENYEEANTRYLLENNNWEGLIIDSSKENINIIKKQNYFWRHKLKAENTFINVENVNEIIDKYKFPKQIGLLSIDIDGNDYWIWEAISVVSPDILVIEYNALYGSEKSLTLKYEKNFKRPDKGIYKCLYGASLKALTSLSERKGYSLVATNLNGNNAFFVKQTLLNDKVYEQDYKTCFKENSFKEHIDKNGEISALRKEEIDELLNNKNVIEV